MIASLKKNWKVYSMESICLGLFMLSASLCATILEYPGSLVHQTIPNSNVRLCVMGIAMGITASLLIYSPMGKTSGAHMNPAISLTFVRLGKLQATDAFYYIAFQLLGGTAAVQLMALLLGSTFTNDPINYIITTPGATGTFSAFAVETLMSFGMMLMVLIISNHKSLSGYTGVVAGFFVTACLISSAPISGFSMNPARTLASAIPAMQYNSLWIYTTAPFLGMLAAAEVFRLFKGHAVCAKIHHETSYLCIFKCGYCNHDSENTGKNIEYL